MSHQDNIHCLLWDCALEVLEFVKQQEQLHADGWVPAAEVKDRLQLNLIAVPKYSKQYGAKGWLFGILARMLEDKGLLICELKGSRSFCRSTKE